MGYYIWPALLIWGFDRALRLGRLVWNNKLWNPTHPGDALVELLSEDTIRLTMSRRISWTPGQHAYVILPSVSKLPFEAHPFTIASIPEASGENKGCDVVFLIRGRSGFTQRLRDLASNDHGCRVPAFLDGPYGCPPDLRQFSTCVLIAGMFPRPFTKPTFEHIFRWFRYIIYSSSSFGSCQVCQPLHIATSPYLFYRLLGSILLVKIRLYRGWYLSGPCVMQVCYISHPCEAA